MSQVFCGLSPPSGPRCCSPRGPECLSGGWTLLSYYLGELRNTEVKQSAQDHTASCSAGQPRFWTWSSRTSKLADLAPSSTRFPARGQHYTTSGHRGWTLLQTHLSIGDAEGRDPVFTMAAISSPPNWPPLPTLSLGVQAWTRDQKTHSEGPKLGYYSSQPMHLWLVHKTAQKKPGSSNQVNTEILLITVRRWKGQVFIPILEMRKWRNRGELTCPNSQGWLELQPRAETSLPADPGLALCSVLWPSPLKLGSVPGYRGDRMGTVPARPC